VLVTYLLTKYKLTLSTLMMSTLAALKTITAK